jgi:membrane-bound serine protease (ClpP class)
MIELIAQTNPGNSSPIIWAFIFIGIALVLFFVEVFIPSAGLIALLGALSIIASLIAFFMHDINTGLIASGVYIIFGPILAWIGFRIWAASPLAKRMVLGGIVEEDEEEAKQRFSAKQEEKRAELQSLVGKQGTTITVLRPIGVVRIGGKRVDAMSETGSIEANVAIEVVSANDNQIKVRIISE